MDLREPQPARLATSTNSNGRPSTVSIQLASLVAHLTPNERVALAAELLAANVREAVHEALANTTRTHTGAEQDPLGNQDTAVPAAMNPEQAAKYCGVGINAIRGLFRTGAIPARRSGRRWIVRREALDEWMRHEEEVEGYQRLDLLTSARGRPSQGGGQHLHRSRAVNRVRPSGPAKVPP